MNKIISCLVLGMILFQPAIGQDKVVFSMASGNISREPEQDSDAVYKRPVFFIFGKEFKNKKITVFNDRQGASVIGDAVFEQAILPTADKTYQVAISEDGISLGGNESLKLKDEFYFKINNGGMQGPFRLNKISIPDAAEYVPGFIAYDAIEIARLKKMGDEEAKDKIRKILKYYGIDDKDNDFLKDELADLNLGQVQFSGVKGGFSGIISSLGNMNVTNFADGIAKFLVERSKEELNVAFFRKFQEFLAKYPEVKIIFPTTVSFIGNIDAYNYAAMLPALRSAFQKDLNAFSTNLLTLRNPPDVIYAGADAKSKERMDKLKNFLNEDPIGRSLVAALLITNDLLKGNNAAEILDNVASDPVCQHHGENFSNAVQFANFLSTSLRSKSEERVWLRKSEVSALVSPEGTLRIYLGLLYAVEKQKPKLNQIEFNFDTTKITLQDFLQKLHNEWDSAKTVKDDFKRLFRQLASMAAEVSDAAQNLVAQLKEGDNASILIYADYARSVSEFLKQSFGFIGNFPDLDSKLTGLKADIARFQTIIDPALDACYDIKSQNYSALVLHTSLVLEEVLGSEYSFKDGYIKYGTFMANVVEAKNSDDVKAAIQAAVLPVGSSSIKRETDFNIGLNAFIGPFGGMEYLPKLKKDKTAFVMGVTAPVGVAFSWGRLGKGKDEKSGGKSLSLFVPLIDVGSLATFRLSDDSSEVASEVKLKNIISPGLYLYYGFGKCPISLGIGGQLGPQLRNVTAKDINIDKNYYFRFGVNLTVDIPFFNFYTKKNDKE